MDNQTVRLRVNGWSNPRFCRVESNLVMFEVMWLGCACPACFARLSAVETRMSASDVSWSVQEYLFPKRDGVPSAVLVVEPKEMPEKVDAFLTNLLGLQISEIVSVATPATMSLA